MQPWHKKWRTTINCGFLPTLLPQIRTWFPLCRVSLLFGFPLDSIIKIRRSWDSLIFIMEIRIPGKIVFVLSGGHGSYPMKSFTTRHHALSKLRGFLVVFLITMKCFRLPATFLKCNLMASMGNFARFHHKTFYWSSFLDNSLRAGVRFRRFPHVWHINYKDKTVLTL